MPSSSPQGQARPVVVALPAEVDYGNAPDVRDQVTGALAGAPLTLILDLSGTEFCDSAGLRELALAHRLAERHGTQIRLVVPPGPLIRLFTLTGLSHIWVLHPTLQAALTGPSTPPE